MKRRCRKNPNGETSLDFTTIGPAPDERYFVKPRQDLSPFQKMLLERARENLAAGKNVKDALQTIEAFGLRKVVAPISVMSIAPEKLARRRQVAECKKMVELSRKLGAPIEDVGEIYLKATMKNPMKKTVRYAVHGDKFSVAKITANAGIPFIFIREDKGFTVGDVPAAFVDKMENLDVQKQSYGFRMRRNPVKGVSWDEIIEKAHLPDLNRWIDVLQDRFSPIGGSDSERKALLARFKARKEEMLSKVLKKNPTGNSVAAHELFTFAVSNEQLYNSRIIPVINNLVKKIKRGVYDHNLALKLWKYVADDAAKRYNKEFSDRGPLKGYGDFTVPIRMEAARELQKHYNRYVVAPFPGEENMNIFGKNPRKRRTAAQRRATKKLVAMNKRRSKRKTVKHGKHYKFVVTSTGATMPMVPAFGPSTPQNLRKIAKSLARGFHCPIKVMSY